MDKYRETKKKYDEENMKRYSVNMPIGVYNQMMLEVEKFKTNKNAYTIQAIKEKIIRDTRLKARLIDNSKKHIHKRPLVAKAIPKKAKVKEEE